MKKGIKIYIELLLTFMKIGVCTFGGGYAMISILYDVCVEKKKWMEQDEMLDLTAIAESTPGPIAINCSTYVGYKLKGIWGAVFATVGMVLPSFVIIFIISLFLDNLLEIKAVAAAFQGIKVAVGVVIILAAIKMAKKADRSKLSLAILFVSTAVMLLISIFSVQFSSFLLLIIAGAFSGVLFALLHGKTGKDGEKR